MGERLTRVENRTYLCLALIFPEIERHAGVSKSRLQVIIQHIPATVQEAYEKILERSTNLDLSRRLLHIVLAAERQLNLTEKNTALALVLSDDLTAGLDLESEISFQSTVRELCGLFVNVENSKVYLIHQTAKDFLVDNGHLSAQETTPKDKQWRWQHSFKLTECHQQLSEICVSYLLHIKYGSQDARESSLSEARNHLKRYAVDFWASHLIKSETSSSVLKREPVFAIPTKDSTEDRKTWLQTHALENGRQCKVRLGRPRCAGNIVVLWTRNICAVLSGIF